MRLYALHPLLLLLVLPSPVSACHRNGWSHRTYIEPSSHRIHQSLMSKHISKETCKYHCAMEFLLNRNENNLLEGEMEINCVKKVNYGCICEDKACLPPKEAEQKVEEMKQELLKLKLTPSRECYQLKDFNYGGVIEDDSQRSWHCPGDEECILKINGSRYDEKERSETDIEMKAQFTLMLVAECGHKQKEHTCTPTLMEHKNYVEVTLFCACDEDKCFTSEYINKKLSELRQQVAEVPLSLICDKSIYMAVGKHLSRINGEYETCEKRETCQMVLVYTKDSKDNTEAGSIISSCNNVTQSTKDGCESQEITVKGVLTRTASCHCSTDFCIRNDLVEKKWKEIREGKLTYLFEPPKENKPHEENEGAMHSSSPRFTILLLFVAVDLYGKLVIYFEH